MAIQREDLVAAATAGLLQYRQVDPLLIFLLQRDLLAQRAALLQQPRPKPRPAAGIYMLLSCIGGLLAIVVASLFAASFTVPAVASYGAGALFFFTVLYALGAIGLAAWFKRRGLGVPVRVMTGLVIALVPLAVFGMQQANFY